MTNNMVTTMFCDYKHDVQWRETWVTMMFSNNKHGLPWCSVIGSSDHNEKNGKKHWSFFIINTKKIRRNVLNVSVSSPDLPYESYQIWQRRSLWRRYPLLLCSTLRWWRTKSVWQILALFFAASIFYFETFCNKQKSCSSTDVLIQQTP